MKVWGSSHRRWASLGWEKSHLGYPTSGEQAWPEGQGELRAAGVPGRPDRRCAAATRSRLRTRSPLKRGPRGVEVSAEGCTAISPQRRSGAVLWRSYQRLISGLRLQHLHARAEPEPQLAMRKSGQINMQVLRPEQEPLERRTPPTPSSTLASLTSAPPPSRCMTTTKGVSLARSTTSYRHSLRGRSPGPSARPSWASSMPGIEPGPS